MTNGHVLYPEILVSTDFKLSMEDYQWLSNIELAMTRQP